jgi:hypothetical protein
MRTRLALFPLLCAGTAFASEPVATETSPLQQAWQDAALSLFHESHRGFAELEGREARFGEAVTLLIQQPKTDRNIRRAFDIFAELSSGADELAIASRYHLGRIEQSHRATPDPAAAAEHYRKLVADHPGHPLAELALVKLAIIEFYEVVADDVRRARFDAFLAQVDSLRTPEHRRDLHVLLADTALRFGYSPEVALEQLLAADKIGFVRPLMRANNWVRIGNLASETGRAEIARDYYTRFLDTFKRDNRRLMVGERLAALPPAAQTPGS